MDNLTKTISKNENADCIVWIPENRAGSIVWIPVNRSSLSIEDDGVEHLGNPIKDEPEDPYAEELLQIEAPPVSIINDPLADYSGQHEAPPVSTMSDTLADHSEQHEEQHEGLVDKHESAEEKPYSLVLKDIEFSCNRCTFTTRWFRCLNNHWEEHRKPSERVLSSDGVPVFGHEIEKCFAPFEEEFKCPYCRLVTASEQGLQVHMAKQHVLLSDYTCCDCGKSLSSTSALLYHRRLHHPATINNVNCPYCHLISPSVDQLSRHVNKKHILERNHKCNRCDFSSCDFKDLALHNSKCLTKEIQNCDFCVSSLISFKTHKCKKNESIGKCPFCEFDSHNVEELLSHFSENHLDMRIKNCSLCKFSCTLTEELKAHIIEDHPDYRFCDFCVVHIEQLVVHMRETHLVDNAIYKCTNCWYSSYFYENLITHIDDVHPTLLCLHCSSTFGSLDGLLLHMKDSHIKCPLCSYVGCNVGELMSHFDKKHSSKLVMNSSKSTLTLAQRFLKKLQEHNEEKHSSNKGPSQCKICNFFTFVVHKLIKWIETDHFITSDMECKLREKLIAELKSFLSDESQDEFFNCPCCFLCFTSRNHALKHYVNCHNTPSSFANKDEETLKSVCPYCGFVTSTLIDLKSHIFLFHRNCLFSCQGKCRFTCQSVEKLLEHIKESHNTQSSFQCPLCRVEFSALENLLSHIHLTHADKYECLHCEFNTVNFEDYMLHIYESHGYVYKHRCMFCESSFSNQESLLNHVGSIHIVRRLYKCIHCYFETCYEEKLKRHIKNIHWEKLFKCLKCTFFTASLKKLERHIELKHLLRPHLISCAKCKFETANEWKMITHRNLHHNTFDYYSCYECDFTHPDMSVLMTHISENHCFDGEFVCTICKYGSKFCHGIMNHLRRVHQKYTLSHLISEFYVIPTESNGKIIEIQSESPSGYECFLCHFKGTSLTNLQNHVIFCHSSKIAHISCRNSDCNTVFGCPCCKFLAADMPKLIKHILRCHSGKLNALFCMLCDFSSTIITDLALHVQQEHSKASFISFYIEKEAIKRETYLTHTTSTLLSSSFYCYFCKKPNSNRRELREHIRSLCFNEAESLFSQPNYKCPFCCFEFVSLDDIIEHISKKYFFGVKCLISIWLFICDQLKSHIATQHLFCNIHFKCLFCIQCSNLIQEIRRHTRCGLCQFSTNHKSKLFEHYKEIHINNDCMVSPASSNGVISVLKNSSKSCNIDFICDVCSDLSEKLITHIKTEYAFERYLNCILCDKKFDCQIELVHHILREHKNSTYFQCPICSLKTKSMYSIWEFKEHILHKHRFIEEFQCYICQDIFEMISNHFNIQHKRTCSHFQKIDRKSDKDTPGTAREAGKQQKKDMTVNMKKNSKQDKNLIDKPFDSELKTILRKDKDFLKCPSCNIEFNSEEEFKGHQDFIGCFKCPKCMDIFENFVNLKSHLEVHKLFYFKCDYCNYSDVETNGFTKHVLETHFEKIIFIVKICRNNINQVSTYFDSQGIATLQSNGENIKNDSSSRNILNLNNQNRVTQLFEFLKRRMSEESFCCYCDDKFNSVVELEVHLCSNHEVCRPKPAIRSVITCRFCTPLFGELVNYLTEMYKNSKIYECPYCSQYKKLQLPNLVKHILNVHPINGLSCWICQISFINLDALTTHILEDHSSVNVYKCEHCKYKDINLDNFLEHVNETHSDFKGYKCFECCLLFQTFEDNLQHYIENHWSVDCNSSCEHSSFIKSLTNYHVNHVNNKYNQKCPQLNCSECHFFAKTSRDLVSDFNKYREKDKPDSVDGNISLSVSKNDLQEHGNFFIYLPNSCEFQCIICNQTMSSIKYAIVHFSENHASSFKITNIINELKPYLKILYNCSFCGFSMSDFNDLKKHIKSKHKNITKFVAVEKCLQCNFSGSSSKMKAHYRQHSESELLKCRLCDYVCMKPSDMSLHFKKIHSNQCECPFCDFVTRRAPSFRNHIQNHYNIFYKCPICDQLINSFIALVNHIESKHGDLLNTEGDNEIDLVESDLDENVNPSLIKRSRKQACSHAENVNPSLIKRSRKQACSHAENVNPSLIKDSQKPAKSSDENVNSSMINNSQKQANENVNSSMINNSHKQAYSHAENVNPSMITNSYKQAYSHAENVIPSIIKDSQKQTISPDFKHRDLLNTDLDEGRIQPVCNNEIELIDLVESDSDENKNPPLIKDSHKQAYSQAKNVNPSLIKNFQDQANSPDDSVNPSMIKNSHKQAYSPDESVNPSVIKISHKLAYSHAENVIPSIIKDSQKQNISPDFKHRDLLNTDLDEGRIQPGCNNEIEVIDLVESDSDEDNNPSLIKDSQKPAKSSDNNVNPPMINNSYYGQANSPNEPLSIKDSSGKKYNCSKCLNYLTGYRRKMIKHLKNHDKVKSINEIKSVTSKSRLRECPLCGFELPKHQNNIIREHINAVHAINGTLKCKVCNFRTENVDEMLLHSHSLRKPLLNSNSQSLFSCKKCSYRTINLNLFNNHLDTNHQDFSLERSQEINSGALLKTNYQDLSTTKQVEHKCHQCNFIYRKPEELTVHTEENHTHQYECLHCPFRCSLLADFNTHRQKNHQDSKLYSCSHCKFMALFPGEINLHVTEVHSDIGIQECLLCKLQFTVLNELIHHMATTHGKKYENVIHCLDCRLLFISVAEYASHFLQAHVTNENSQSLYVIVKLHKLVQNIISSADTGKTDINAYTYMLGIIIKQGTPDSVDRIDFCSDCKELAINLSNHVLSIHNNCRGFQGKSFLYNNINHKPSSIYNCQYCEFSFFKSFKLLLNHMNESHVEDKCVSCLQLSKKFVKHIKKAHCNKSFKCSYCEFVTIKKENFDLHFKKFHCFSCIKCNFIHESRTSLEEHMYTNHLLKKCPHCSYRSHKMDEFKKHMKHNHGDGKKAGCIECGLRFHSIKQMLFHVKKMHRNGLKVGSIYKCPKCEYTAKSYRLLLKHKRCIAPMMKCCYCDVRHYRSFEDLNRHLYKKHKVHQFSCSCCSFHCRILQDFEKHMNENHKDATNHVCPHCGYKTNLKSFISHIQKLHDLSIKTINKTNKPLKVCTIHKCLVCDYSCSLTRELKLHVQESHEIVCPSGISELQNKEKDNLLPFNGSIIDTKICFKSENPLEDSQHCNSPLTEEGIKRTQLNIQYFCLICNASKTTLRDINNHVIANHYKEEFWVCNQCNFISETPSEMSDHFHDVHSKQIIPFTCHWCGFNTSQLTAFRNHIRSVHALKAHQKYPLFTCSLCNRGFKLMRDLFHHFEYAHLSILGDSLYNTLFYIQFFIFKNLSIIIKDVNTKLAFFKAAQEAEKSNDLNVDNFRYVKMTKECDQRKLAMRDKCLNEEECSVIREEMYFKEVEIEGEEDMTDCAPSKDLSQAQPVTEVCCDTEDNKVLDEGDSEEVCNVVKVETPFPFFNEEEIEGEEDMTDFEPSKELPQAQPIKVESRDTAGHKIHYEDTSEKERNVIAVDPLLVFKEGYMTDCAPSKELTQAQPVKEVTRDTGDRKLLQDTDYVENIDNGSLNHGDNNDITYCTRKYHKNKSRTPGVLKGNHKSLLQNKIIKTKHNNKRKSQNTQHLSKKHVKFENNFKCLEIHENKLKCMECSFGCQLEMEMEEHIKKYHENKFFCPNCKDSFSSLCEFNLHVKRTHNNASIYHCPHCNFVSTILKEIIAHTSTDHCHFVFHFCSLCNFKSTNLEILMTHIERKHSSIEKDRLNNCALCNYRTKNKNELSLHIHKHHSSCTPFECPYCDERSPILEEHLRHISGNHSKAKNPMKETVLLKVAKCKNEQSDIKSTNNDSGLFKCPHCEFNTSNFVGLRHHMLECRSGSNIRKEIKSAKNKTLSQNKVPLWNLASLKSVKK